MTLNILSLDDDEGIQLSIRLLLKSQPHFRAQFASDWDSAKLILDTDSIDILLLDINLGDKCNSGIQLLPEIKKNYPDLDVIVVTGERDSGLIIRAIRSGAADYYQKPVQKDLIVCVQKVEWKREKQQHCDALIEALSTAKAQKDFIGESPAFIKVMEMAGRLKNQMASVLIEAETGAGKELLAKHIHELEGNSRRPFIVVNCATLPENLVESELFGHEKGAFTGAVDKKIGKFQLAGGGDIFLDEINSLNLNIQAKLLRVLQEKAIHPVGGRTPVEVNFRVIAATNENLKKMVEKGLFREDLYHRLNVVKLTLPPLRERKEDIPILIEYFITKYAGKNKKRISLGAKRYLLSYKWPGNVRELENIIHSMVVLTKREVMDVDDLPDYITNERVHPAISDLVKDFNNRFDDADVLQMKLKDVQNFVQLDFVKRAIKLHDGNVTETAKFLGKSRQSLYKFLRMVKKYDNEYQNH